MAQLHLNIECTKRGWEFFSIYTVVTRINGQEIELESYTTFEMANDYKELAVEIHGYTDIWIKERKVWIK